MGQTAVAAKKLLRAGTRAGFAPMNDVTQFWDKPSKLTVLSSGKVKRIFVFGFGHKSPTSCMSNIGRRVLSELPTRFPELYPPWKPCRVGTYDCLVSHGARITLLQSPPEIRSQHLGPWAIKTMRGVIQGYIDGKKKMIPGTVQDLFGQVDGADHTQLAPLDTLLDPSQAMETMGAGYEEGVQVGLLDSRDVAAVVVHDDYMLAPGVVQVPPWSRNHHEGFNGVVTSFRKGFLSGLRGARIAIGVGWPGYAEGKPRPYKAELVPKLYPHKHDYPPHIIDRAIEATEDQLRSLQMRWKIPNVAPLRNNWQTMPLTSTEQTIEEKRTVKIAEAAKTASDDIAAAQQELVNLEAERREKRRELMAKAKATLSALRDAAGDKEPSEEDIRAWKRGRRAEMQDMKSDVRSREGKALKRIKRSERVINGLNPASNLFADNTPDRLLGQPLVSHRGKVSLIIAAKRERKDKLRSELAQGLDEDGDDDDEFDDDEFDDDEFDDDEGSGDEDELSEDEGSDEDTDSDGSEDGFVNPFPARNENSRFPARNENSRFSARNENSRFPARNENSRFPARNEDNRFSARNENSRFPARNEDNSFSARNENSRFPARNEDNRFPARNENSRFSARNENNRFSARNERNSRSEEDEFASKFPARNEGNSRFSRNTKWS